MRCIFCLEDKAGSDEHVFPLAIGGPIKTDRLCVSCNSYLGSHVDVTLTDNLLIKFRRAEYGLAGNSRVPPSRYELLEGIAELSDGSGQKIRVTFNPVTGKMDTKAVFHANDVKMPDGSIAKQIIVDASEIDIRWWLWRSEKLIGQTISDVGSLIQAPRDDASSHQENTTN